MGTNNGSDNGSEDEFYNLDGDGTLSEDDFRVLIDGEGNETICVLHRVVDYGGKLYGLLTPVDDYNSDDEQMEVFIFEYRVDGEGNEQFNEVEDDETTRRTITVT